MKIERFEQRYIISELEEILNIIEFNGTQMVFHLRWQHHSMLCPGFARKNAVIMW
jgi:hypothetical protein